MAVDQPRAVVLQSLILREAAAWIEALESTEPPEDFQQWLCWLDADEAHRHAYWDLLELWHRAVDLPPARGRELPPVPERET